jgi:hypothetical protein
MGEYRAGIHREFCWPVVFGRDKVLVLAIRCLPAIFPVLSLLLIIAANWD